MTTLGLQTFPFPGAQGLPSTCPVVLVDEVTLQMDIEYRYRVIAQQQSGGKHPVLLGRGHLHLFHVTQGQTAVNAPSLGYGMMIAQTIQMLVDSLAVRPAIELLKTQHIGIQAIYISQYLGRSSFRTFSGKSFYIPCHYLQSQIGTPATDVYREIVQHIGTAQRNAYQRNNDITRSENQPERNKKQIKE